MKHLTTIIIRGTKTNFHIHNICHTRASNNKLIKSKEPKISKNNTFKICIIKIFWINVFWKS